MRYSNEAKARLALRRHAERRTSSEAYEALRTRRFDTLRFTGTTSHSPGYGDRLKSTWADAVITWRRRSSELPVSAQVWVLLPFDTGVNDEAQVSPGGVA